MNYFKSVWSNLVFSIGNAATQAGKSLYWRNKGASGELKYVSRSAYKSVVVHVAKQLAMASLENELNDLLPKYQKYASEKMLEERKKVQDENRIKLIERQQACDVPFGKIRVSDANGKKDAWEIIAKTKYGRPVPEALILSYEGDTKWTYTDIEATAASNGAASNESESYSLQEKKKNLKNLWNPKKSQASSTTNISGREITTRTVFHIDLTPKVTMSSSKNLILTQVQGRDFSRKELVSGGDFVYNVNGSIVSNDIGVYPTEAVKRFMKIMQYNGIIDVNFITFGLLGVSRIVIKDFSLGACECKNVQPYSFSCVAVEPDDAITIADDTIVSVNKQLSESKWNAWYNTILENKLVEMGVKNAVTTTINGIGTAASSSLDTLVTNI